MSQANTEPDAHPPQPSGEEATGGHPSGSRRTLLVGLAVGVVLFAGVVVVVALAGGGSRLDPDVAFQPDGKRLGAASSSEQTPLPDGTLLAFHSEDEVEVRDYVGEPLVVNFWASWCGPCIEEMPDIQQVADELEGRVTVLGINAQDRAASAREFAADLGITFDLVRDPDGSYFASVGGFGWPTTLLVDDDGIIRYRHTGLLDADKLRDLLETHLGVDAA